MGIINFEKEYSYNIFMNDAIKLAEIFSPFARLEGIGKSVMGREIPIFKLGFSDCGVLFSAGVHARENINPVVMLKIIENICNYYFAAKDSVFKRRAMWFVPLMNPDGYEIVLQGKPYEYYKYNANGVDINRNFPSISYKKTDFTGKYAGSEPETEAFVNFVKNHNTLGYIDFHSRGNCIYYYRKYMNHIYNTRQEIIAKKLSEISGYSLVLPENEIEPEDSGGNTVHFYSEYTGNPAITVETVDDLESFPLNHNLYDSVLKRIGQLPMDFLNIVC